MTNTIGDRLRRARITITTSTTLKDVRISYESGCVNFLNNTAKVLPSYGSGLLLFVSNASFKAIIIDDNTNSTFIWSFQDKSDAVVVVDTVVATKIV